MKPTTVSPILAALPFALALTACSGAGSSPQPQDDAAAADGGSEASFDSSSATVPSDEICNFLLAKTCNGVNPTPAQRSTCKTAFDVSATRGCKPYIDKGWSCLSTKSPAAALGCQLGELVVVDPTCAESGTAMAKCAGAMSDPKCYGGSGTSFTDCPTGWSCNEAIGQCFDNAHSCIGAPCSSFTDCSTGTTCNQALKMCTKG